MCCAGTDWCAGTGRQLVRSSPHHCTVYTHSHFKALKDFSKFRVSPSHNKLKNVAPSIAHLPHNFLVNSYLSNWKLLPISASHRRQARILSGRCVDSIGPCKLVREQLQPQHRQHFRRSGDSAACASRAPLKDRSIIVGSSLYLIGVGYR